MSALRLQAIERIAEIEPALWDRLVKDSGGSVLSQHAFLHAFETSGSVAPDTGWQPRHLLLWENEQLVAAIPLYAKGHSYGEFVFDWAWADAYQRNGLEYYPKWLSAIPFTPVPGARLLTTDAYRALAASALLQWTQKSGLSSLHVLYTTPEDTEALVQAGCLLRTHTQFHWFNRDWPDFDSFLSSLTQPKRKKIRAERRKVREVGVTTCVRTGSEITSEDWAFFLSLLCQHLSRAWKHSLSDASVFF